MMKVLRTPDSCFENLPGYNYEPHYTTIKDDDGTESIGKTNALFVSTLPYPSGERQCRIATEAAANYYKYTNCSHIDH